MKNATDITVLLDRSGSMDAIRMDTIGGFNTFLKGQQAVTGDAWLTLIQFDGHGYDTVIEHQPVASVLPLTLETFQPRGNTPLLDAMARTIDESGVRFERLDEVMRPDKVVVVIITDGLENASQRTTRGDVFAKVALQQDVYGWLFLYLGANQDAIAVAAQYGIASHHAASYTANQAGTNATYGAVSDAVTARRAGASRRAVGFSAAQRSAMKGQS